MPVKSIERKDANVNQMISAGKKAPPFATETLSGSPLKFPGQKLTLLEFWGTWCKPCIDELPFLQDVQEFFSGEYFEILGIANDSRSNVTRFLKNNQVGWDQVITSFKSEDNILNDYSVSSFPSLFLVGGDGIILEETKSLRHYSLYQKVAEHLNQDPQLFLDFILEGDVRLSVPKGNFASVLIKAGDITIKNQFLYEYHGAFVRGFLWPEGAEVITLSIVTEDQDYKKKNKEITIGRDEVISGVLVLDFAE